MVEGSRRWVALGDRAIRFARPKVSARELVRAIKSWPGVVDVVIAREDIAAYFVGPPRVDAGMLAALAELPEVDRDIRQHTLRVRYDGPDLDAVAEQVGVSRDDVIAVHRAATYTVETIGFAPGFAYLTGLDPRLQLPRRATPRPRVPAGSLAIAGEYTSIYPFDSPGGWHLIGTCLVPMFDERGATLALGDEVRFVV